MMDMIPSPSRSTNAGERQPRALPGPTPPIMATVFPPIRWIVPGYVAEGLGILAGRRSSGRLGSLSTGA